MRIYRVEHEEGEYGPHEGEAAGISHRFSENRPRPQYSPHTDAELKYGFATKSRFYRWFNDKEEHRKMHKQGYVLSTYKITDPSGIHYRDRAQVMFDPKMAVLIERRPLVK